MSDSRAQVNIRLTDEDAALLARLERAYGLNTAGVTRFAWRYLEEHGPMRPKEGRMKEFNLNGNRVRANVPDEGFDLKTAAREIRQAAAWAGIKSGRWEPVNAGVAVDTLADDEIVARVWNTRRGPVSITAADIKLALEYLA